MKSYRGDKGNAVTKSQLDIQIRHWGLRILTRRVWSVVRGYYQWLLCVGVMPPLPGTGPASMGRTPTFPLWTNHDKSWSFKTTVQQDENSFKHIQTLPSIDVKHYFTFWQDFFKDIFLLGRFGCYWLWACADWVMTSTWSHFVAKTRQRSEFRPFTTRLSNNSNFYNVQYTI